MFKKTLFTIVIVVSSPSLFSQISFTDESAKLNNSSLKSGVALAITDMNNDGLDDLIRRNNSENLEIEYQNADGTFQMLAIGNIGSLWGISIADVDKNDYNDIIAGGRYNGLKLFSANSDGTSFSTSTLNGSGIFLQNSNFADIDNDGEIDFFGYHDDGVSSAYRNDGSGIFDYDLSLINAESTVSSDNSGNYGSIWMDYDNDGDLDMYLSKCRLGVSDVNDGRRLNLLFQNDGFGNYTDVAEAAGLLPHSQTWSTAFEDFDNDGDLDAVMINHDIVSQIYENNGDGTFTDITASTGITTELQDLQYGIQIVTEDFNNDTFIDILMTATFSSGNHYLFLNNGDKTFTAVTNAFNTNGNIMQSAASGDLNNDGFIDIIAGFADSFNTPSNVPDQLFFNDVNLNNWTKIILKGVESNSNGIGARIEIYGDWGMQIREVRAGESYGTQNSLTTHFGIADATSIDKIVIKWPSGTIDQILNPEINSTHTFIEGENALGINALSINNFDLYPTLAEDFITINTNFNNNTVLLNIFSVTGKSVLQQNIDGFGKSILDVSNLNSGIYFVKVAAKTVKLIKK